MAAGARGGDSAVPDAGEEDDGRERCVGCVSGGGDEEVCAAGEEEENDRAASSSSSSVLTTAASRGPPPSPPSSSPSTTPPRHRSRSTAAPTLPSSSSSSAPPSLSSPPSPPRPSRWPCRSTSSPGTLPSPTSSRRRPSPTSPSPRLSSGSTSSSPPPSSPSPISVLGTFITEGDKGAEICKKVLATEASAQMYAERLTELAATLGFDGWLMNIEVDLDIQFIDNLKEFIKHLTKTMHDAVPGSLVIWYDAITVNGDLAWQNKLNEYNKPFFDLCDRFFSNYSWTEKDPEDSAAVSGDRKYDVYMGIDVFGRNTFGGGQWNETSLELVVVGDDGVLQSICEQTTFGIIKDIGVLDWRYTHFGLMPKIEGKEILVVLSDSGKLSLLYFCSEMHRAMVLQNCSLLGGWKCDWLPPLPEQDLTEIASEYSFRKSLREAFRFITSSPHKPVVFYRTWTPSHFENGEWSSGGTCNRTVPFKPGEAGDRESDTRMWRIEGEEFAKAVADDGPSNAGRLKLLDTFELSLLRPDGHPGPYRTYHPFEKGGAAKVQNDCLHWCLPGPIDAWNDVIMQVSAKD